MEWSFFLLVVHKDASLVLCSELRFQVCCFGSNKSEQNFILFYFHISRFLEITLTDIV